MGTRSKPLLTKPWGTVNAAEAHKEFNAKTQGRNGAKKSRRCRCAGAIGRMRKQPTRRHVGRRKAAERPPSLPPPLKLWRTGRRTGGWVPGGMRVGEFRASHPVGSCCARGRARSRRIRAFRRTYGKTMVPATPGQRPYQGGAATPPHRVGEGNYLFDAG